MTLHPNLILLALISCCLILFYFAFSVNLRENERRRKIDGLSEALVENDSIGKLLNGSAIDNIPALKILTNNESVATANRCSETPIRVGDKADDHDCISVCANLNAKSINVGDGDEYIVNDTQLKRGGYCKLGRRPNCNMTTTRAFMTLNSIVCKSKFPRVFGGETGDTVLACNNTKINDPNNALWDNKLGRVVTSDNVEPNFDENESYFGVYRYVCRINGTDDNNNRYVQHPFERLQPIRNYCAGALNSAHPEVTTVFDESGRNYRCDCGNPKRTRVTNMYKNDPTTMCIDQDKAASSREHDSRGKKLLRIPYNCFTIKSKVTSVARMLPCPGTQFLEGNSEFSVAQFNYDPNDGEYESLTEHPNQREIGNVKFTDRKGQNIYVV
ncbi:hypothetical protein QAD02_001449 [Eretmocerus hayati]|uniref:Uncharacterized protein n=1 Tax=Eretmocerus hayati TaxID=131215 RepID=A0ACC2NG99_9HYME|nr:hypothetical protein QAD02_001449 [Eretmocerus hayati]